MAKRKKPQAPVRKPVAGERAIFADKKMSAEMKKHRTGITAQTADGFDNFVSRIGLNNKNTLSAGTYTYNLVTRNRILLELSYRGSWIVGRVIDCRAKDMTRGGITITTTKGNGDLKKVDAAISKLKLWTGFREGQQWGDLYGGALAVVQVAGQKMDTPLKLDTITKGQFQGLVVYDRWQLNPVLDHLIDSGPDMGLPAFYQVVNDPRLLEPDNNEAKLIEQGQKIHFSRVIRFGGIKLPYMQAITEQLWGESKLERLWDRLIAFDNATMSAASLIDRANLRTVKVDKLREIIAAGGDAYDALVQMFDLVRQLQTNEHMTLLDKEDEFISDSYTFTGLAEMILQLAQQLSGSTGIPLVVLFGQSPSGLNSNGDTDLRTYYDSVKADQESEFRNGWELVLKVLWRSTFGQEMPDDLEFSFNPLWQQTETEKANNAKTTAETIIGAFENNVTDKPTTLRELRDKSGDTGLFSNITDEMIAEAELEPAPEPDMNGGEGDEPPKPNENPEDPATTPVKNFDRKGWLGRLFGS
jgi:phage-related protein (TIGR01555 family)